MENRKIVPSPLVLSRVPFHNFMGSQELLLLFVVMQSYDAEFSKSISRLRDDVQWEKFFFFRV